MREALLKVCDCLGLLGLSVTKRIMAQLRQTGKVNQADSIPADSSDLELSESRLLLSLVAWLLINFRVWDRAAFIQLQDMLSNDQSQGKSMRRRYLLPSLAYLAITARNSRHVGTPGGKGRYLPKPSVEADNLHMPPPPPNYDVATTGGRTCNEGTMRHNAQPPVLSTSRISLSQQPAQSYGAVRDPLHQQEPSHPLSQPHPHWHPYPQRELAQRATSATMAYSALLHRLRKLRELDLACVRIRRDIALHLAALAKESSAAGAAGAGSVVGSGRTVLLRIADTLGTGTQLQLPQLAAKSAVAGHCRSSGSSSRLQQQQPHDRKSGMRQLQAELDRVKQAEEQLAALQHAQAAFMQWVAGGIPSGTKRDKISGEGNNRSGSRVQQTRAKEGQEGGGVLSQHQGVDTEAHRPSGAAASDLTSDVASVTVEAAADYAAVCSAVASAGAALADLETRTGQLFSAGLVQRAELDCAAQSVDADLTALGLTAAGIDEYFDCLPPRPRLGDQPLRGGIDIDIESDTVHGAGSKSPTRAAAPPGTGIVLEEDEGSLGSFFEAVNSSFLPGMHTNYQAFASNASSSSGKSSSGKGGGVLVCPGGGKEGTRFGEAEVLFRHMQQQLVSPGPLDRPAPSLVTKGAAREGDTAQVRAAEEEAAAGVRLRELRDIHKRTMQRAAGAAQRLAPYHIAWKQQHL